MLSDLTDPEAVRQAAAEFNDVGRDEFLRRYGFRPALRYFARIDGREYDSKALAGVAYGKQFPTKGPLHPTEFSGGEATVRRTLERLGFEVLDKKGHSSGGPAQELSVLIESVCDLLAARETGSDNFAPDDLTHLIRELIPPTVAAAADRTVDVKGGLGIGTAADVPWVGLFPSGHTSAQSGFYLVYLFAKDGSCCYLSLNQGTEEVRGGLGVLRKRAIDLRRAAGPEPDLLREINLRSANLRPRKYEAGSAYAIAYDRSDVPGDSSLDADLRRMMAVLDRVRRSGLTWDPVMEPLHVVLKWDASEPEAFTAHREVEEAHESVWWGRKSQSASPSISTSRLVELQKQIHDEVPTFAFFYSHGSVHRARVLEATVERPDSGDERLPTIYADQTCNFFVRIGSFDEIDADWLAHSTVLANQPDEDSSRMAAALSSQTTPLFVYLLWNGGRADAVEGGSDDVAELEELTLADVHTEIAQYLRDAELDFGPEHDSFVRSAIVALATKRFLLLTGLSGSGKTRLGIALGQWFGPDRLSVVAVRPDWTGPEAVFGFENGLSPVREGKHAWTMTEPLAFMLRASRDPANPYLLLLDEMNLAHVERYFADMLSGMESGAPTVPNVQRDGDEWRLQEPPKVVFPDNLFIVGTVNIDETTYMFSPKVLDRANTIEFRVRTSDLRPGAGPIREVEPGSSAKVRRFLHAATTFTDDDWQGRSQMAGWLQELHALLSAHDREFGHRVFSEALRFGALLSESGEVSPTAALDAQVLQKVLPRFHGSIRQIADALNSLGSWTWFGPGTTSVSSSFDPLSPPEGQPALPSSFDKIRRMTRRLRANHFVGFAE